MCVSSWCVLCVVFCVLCVVLYVPIYFRLTLRLVTAKGVYTASLISGAWECVVLLVRFECVLL